METVERRIMTTSEQESEQAHQNLIALTDRAADAALDQNSPEMRRKVAYLLVQAQAQLSEMATTEVDA